MSNLICCCSTATLACVWYMDFLPSALFGISCWCNHFLFIIFCPKFSRYQKHPLPTQTSDSINIPSIYSIEKQIIIGYWIWYPEYNTTSSQSLPTGKVLLWLPSLAKGQRRFAQKNVADHSLGIHDPQGSPKRQTCCFHSLMLVCFVFFPEKHIKKGVSIMGLPGNHGSLLPSVWRLLFCTTGPFSVPAAPGKHW